MLKPVENQVIWSFYRFSDLIDVFRVQTWNSWGKIPVRIAHLYIDCVQTCLWRVVIAMEITGQPELLPWLLLGQIRSRSEILWGRAAFTGPFLAGREKGRAKPCCLLLVNVWILSSGGEGKLGSTDPSAKPESAVCSFACWCIPCSVSGSPRCHQRLFQLGSCFVAPPALGLQCSGVKLRGAHCWCVKPLCMGIQRHSCTKSENAGSVNDPKCF